MWYVVALILGALLLFVAVYLAVVATGIALLDAPGAPRPPKLKLSDGPRFVIADGLIVSHRFEINLEETERLRRIDEIRQRLASRTLTLEHEMTPGEVIHWREVMAKAQEEAERRERYALQKRAEARLN